MGQVFVKIMPDQQYEYVYEIPAEHLGGTHWSPAIRRGKGTQVKFEVCILSFSSQFPGSVRPPWLRFVLAPS